MASVRYSGQQTPLDLLSNCAIREITNCSNSAAFSTSNNSTVRVTDTSVDSQDIIVSAVNSEEINLTNRETLLFLDNKGNIVSSNNSVNTVESVVSVAGCSADYIVANDTTLVQQLQQHSMTSHHQSGNSLLNVANLEDILPETVDMMKMTEHTIHIEGELAEEILSQPVEEEFMTLQPEEHLAHGSVSQQMTTKQTIGSGKRNRKPTHKGEAYNNKRKGHCQSSTPNRKHMCVYTSPASRACSMPPSPDTSSTPTQLSMELTTIARETTTTPDPLQPLQLEIIKQEFPTPSKPSPNQRLVLSPNKKRKRRKILSIKDKNQLGKSRTNEDLVSVKDCLQPRFQCLKCPRTYSKLTQLKTHFRTHDDHNQQLRDAPAKRVFSCDECGMSFSSPRHLRSHQQHEHSAASTPPLQCKLCTSTFTHAASFKVHMRAHRGEKPYQCTECGAEFVQSGHLMIHKRIHTGEKPYTCDICYVQFKQISHLKTHVRTHTQDKPYKCDECDAAFAQNSSLKRHKRSHTGEKPFKCEVCSMTFVVKSNLQRHTYTHTGEKPYSCDICAASFGQVIDLKRHKISHTGIKPFKCDLCDARFSRNNNLKWHLLTHAEGASHKCELCGVFFATPGDLRFHKRIHEPPKPFQCSKCPASFQQSCSLSNHQLIHTSDFPTLKKLRGTKQKTGNKVHACIQSKPFACDLCSTRFCEKRSWRRHMIAVHATNKEAFKVEIETACQSDIKVESWTSGSPSLKDSAILSTNSTNNMHNNDSSGNNENFSTVSFTNPGTIISTNQYLTDVIGSNCVIEQAQAQAMQVDVIPVQQQQLPQVIIQNVSHASSQGNVPILNGLQDGNTNGNTDTTATVVDQSSFFNTTSSGLLSQLIISTGPNEPARQARPAGNCPNHSAHILTLVDARANHWQAWCLCDAPTVQLQHAPQLTDIQQQSNHEPTTVHPQHHQEQHTVKFITSDLACSSSDQPFDTIPSLATVVSPSSSSSFHVVPSNLSVGNCTNVSTVLSSTGVSDHTSNTSSGCPDLVSQAMAVSALSPPAMMRNNPLVNTNAIPATSGNILTSVNCSLVNVDNGSNLPRGNGGSCVVLHNSNNATFVENDVIGSSGNHGANLVLLQHSLEGRNTATLLTSPHQQVLNANENVTYLLPD